MSLESKLEFADLEAVGPGTPSGRFLRHFWQPLHRSRDLRGGQAKPVEILGEKFTLYRGQDGAPHIAAFRCPHRGTQLSVGWVEGNDLRCRYHGWKYDATGQCIEQPNEDRPFCARVKLPNYPTRDYAGLIWGYFGEGAPPAFRQYPDFDQPGVLIADPPEILPCNFWNRLDNDMGHVPWVHKATATRMGWGHYLVLRREGVEETPYGMALTRFAGKSETQRELGMRGMAHFYMPNAFQFWQRTRAKGYEDRDLWDTKMTWTVPVNDHTYVGFDVTHTALMGDEAQAYAASRLSYHEAEAQSRWDIAEKVLAGDMTLEELPEELGAATCFEIEDYVTQVGQGPVKGRPRENLGQTDVKLGVLRRMWLREVTALLEGRPVTEWKIPAAPFTKAMVQA
jgi:5,5'-dehydrodivanillate O-demethylase oxygenase subunit